MPGDVARRDEDDGDDETAVRPKRAGEQRHGRLRAKGVDPKPGDAFGANAGNEIAGDVVERGAGGERVEHVGSFRVYELT